MVFFLIQMYGDRKQTRTDGQVTENKCRTNINDIIECELLLKENSQDFTWVRIDLIKSCGKYKK